MLVANFNLSSTQIAVLCAFRVHTDTRPLGAEHPASKLDPGVAMFRKLCREGYLAWHDGDAGTGRRPGYSLTAKGEMMLRLIECELRRNLQWFDAPETLPESRISGGKSDVAKGKATLNRHGVAVRKRQTG
jgi:DNA-binding MarR family transcriptional regulator